MAIAVIFGLAFATFLTLVLVPVMVSLSDDFGDWLKRVFLARAGAERGAAASGTPAASV